MIEKNKQRKGGLQIQQLNKSENFNASIMINRKENK